MTDGRARWVVQCPCGWQGSPDELASIPLARWAITPPGIDRDSCPACGGGNSQTQWFIVKAGEIIAPD